MRTKSARWFFSSVLCFINLVTFANAGQLVYSTYIGGSGTETLYGSAIDSAGNIYVTGYTDSSTDFPATIGSFDTVYNGGIADAYVCKLNSDGTALDYSILLGGSGYDDGWGITVDDSGNAYILGSGSADFPVTPGAFDTTHHGVYVAKINAAGSDLIYSTFLGSGAGAGIKVDNNGNVYIIGCTSSSAFPTTPGAFDTTLNSGGLDTFVSKLNTSGSTLIYSTYLGGTGNDYASDLAIDSNGNVYIIGYTNSTTGFPTPPGAFDTTYNDTGNFNDVFVSKLNATGSALIYSTFLGGGDYDYGKRIVVNSTGEACIIGYTKSSTFPTTSGAYDRTFNSIFYNDVFLTKLNAAGSNLIFSTFLGGIGSDIGYGLFVDDLGYIYITGYTSSTDFPITLDAIDSTGDISTDVFVAKFNPTGSDLLYSSYFGGTDGDYGKGIYRDSAGNIYVAGSTYSIDFPTTPGVYDTTYNGGIQDSFVIKLTLPRPTEIKQELWRLYEVP